MKVQRVDSGVFRFEPDETPVWELSPEQFLNRGWSRGLVGLVGRHLRPGPAPEAQIHPAPALEPSVK